MINVGRELRYSDLKIEQMYYTSETYATKYFYKVAPKLIYNLVLYTRGGRTLYYTSELIGSRWDLVPDNQKQLILDKYFSEVLMEEFL